MDGDRRECPIVPDQLLKITVDEEELFVSATCDTIVRYVDSRYNHLRYIDEEQQALVYKFLGNRALAALTDNGVPCTSPQPRVTQAIHDAWLRSVGAEPEEEQEYEEVYEDVEIRGELMPGDPIDAQVQSATAHLDAEIDYYMGEWGTDGAL